MTLKLTDAHSIDDYINQIVLHTDDQTIERYFVIVYGPIASGKSLARKIACVILNKYFEPTTPPDLIFNTLVNIDIDKMIEDTIIDHDITVGQKFREEIEKVKEEGPQT
jgi:hypothetical protein